MKTKFNFLKSLIVTVLLVAIIITMALIYAQAKPQSTQGSKKITIEILVPNEETKEFTLNTDVEYLRQALEEKEGLINGIDSEYGLFITEVNGRIANAANQEWWCITKSGEQVLYGVDEIAIKDGEHYEITLTIGY